MRAEIKKTLSTFHSKLSRQLKNYPLDLFSVQFNISLCESCLLHLYSIVANSKFKSKQNEIGFFKNDKPKVHGHFKYFIRLQRYILIKGISSSKKQNKFINDRIRTIHKWYLKESQYIIYCKLSHTRLDDKYFIRQKYDSYFDPEQKPFLNDPKFSTRHSDLKTELFANELLLSFFSKELRALSKNVENNKRIKFSTGLNWTKSKTDLVELLYALKSSLAIQDGNIEMKVIATVFEEVFNTSLGNYYKTYGEIKARSK